MALHGSLPTSMSHHQRRRHNSLVGNESQFGSQHPVPALPSHRNQLTPTQQPSINTSSSRAGLPSVDPSDASVAEKMPRSNGLELKMHEQAELKVAKGVKLAPSRFIRDALSGRRGNSPQFLLDIAAFSVGDIQETLTALKTASSTLKAYLIATRSAHQKLVAEGGLSNEGAAVKARREKLKQEVEERRKKMEAFGREIEKFSSDIAYLEQHIAEKNGADAGGGGARYGIGESVQADEEKLKRYGKYGGALGGRSEGCGIAV